MRKIAWASYLLSGSVIVSVGHRFLFAETITINNLANEHIVGSQINRLFHFTFNKA